MYFGKNLTHLFIYLFMFSVPGSAGAMKYVAMYDYDSRTTDDLNFEKGEQLYILST